MKIPEKFINKKILRINPGDFFYIIITYYLCDIIENMLEEIKQFYQKEGLKAQLGIMPILFLIEYAIKPNRTIFGHIQAFVFLYLATMLLLFFIIYFGKKM